MPNRIVLRKTEALYVLCDLCAPGVLLPIYGPGTIQLPGCLAAAKMNGRAGAVPHLRGPLIKSPAHHRRSVLHILNPKLI